MEVRHKEKFYAGLMFLPLLRVIVNEDALVYHLSSKSSRKCMQKQVEKDVLLWTRIQQ